MKNEIKRIINIPTVNKKHVLIKEYQHAMKQINDLIRRNGNITLDECSIRYEGEYFSVEQFDKKIKGMK